MTKILVTGANGQLGSELLNLSSSYPEFDWVFVGRKQLDLNNVSAINEQLIKFNPDVIFNCAAYTAVDKAEEEPEAADTINHLAVGAIAEFAYENHVRFIHVSTDYVFDGTKNSPLTELEVTNPINVYGASKLAGEVLALKNNPTAIIIRTSWVYSEFGNNFVKTMLRLMKEREQISVVDDQIGSPTYAADLAEVLIEISKAPKWKPGIYNYSNEGEVSWFDFAKAIQQLSKSDCNVHGVPTTSYPTPANRPAFSLLDKSKIKETFGIAIPDYKDSLLKCLTKLSSQQ
ncbi:dTDP-4-dehydrorhamnose reductase [Flavobacterium sp.]|uniref:dTDP-4-dehydrorhamnose reductase n=1 Tax=Flavobacterium sp. TaxID=239 RepID=UPI0026185BE6|nr:dTDP-4-dehydrorhamnose reductase [Flavobacterium sp.]MDG2433728.1 dTDP-4-dehydrorhamnose reductase [Flavobacterium sp.]